MRTAAPNEESLVADGDAIALPSAPPVATNNKVIPLGSTIQVFASGTDKITWGTSTNQTSITSTQNLGLNFFYFSGTWFCATFNPLTGPDTDVQWVTYAGSSATPQSGPPNSGTWVQSQLYVDGNNALWVCSVGGTPGTWVQLTYGSAKPAGRMYPTNQTVSTTQAETQVTSLTADFVQGGVTFGSNALTVPIAGVYRVNWQVGFQVSNSFVPAGYYNSMLAVNAANARISRSYQATSSVQIPSVGDSDLINLAANAQLTLWFQQSGGTVGVDYANQMTWLSVELI